MNAALDRFKATPAYADLDARVPVELVGSLHAADRRTQDVHGAGGRHAQQDRRRELKDTNRWREIWDLNRERVANENLIYPRLVLLMP